MSVGNPVFTTLQASPDAWWRYLVDEAIPYSRQLPSELQNALHEVRVDLVRFQAALKWWQSRSATATTGLTSFDDIIGPAREGVKTRCENVVKLITM